MEEKIYLSAIKKSIKFVIKDPEVLLTKVKRFSTNQNYPGSVQTFIATDHVKGLGSYNEVYIRYDSIKDKTHLKFYSDFGMSSFNFDKFHGKNINKDDHEIQKRFYKFLLGLRENNIITFKENLNG